MKIKTIDINDIGCLEKLAIKPGSSLTVIEGRNAVGKSTVLNALRYILEKGHDPSLLRKGAEKGSITLNLDDGCQILVTITPEKTTRIAKHPKYGKISKVQEWVENVIQAVSFDPAAFLTAKPKDRVNIFLRALPKKLTRDQLAFIPADALKEIDFDDHALEVIGNDKCGLYGKLYQDRREINRISKDKAGTIAEMERTLRPQPPGGDWQSELNAVNNLIETLQLETQEDINQAEGTYAMVVSQYNLEATEAIGKIELNMANAKAILDAEYQKKLSELLASNTSLIAERKEKRDALIAKATASKDAGLEAFEQQYKPKLETLIEARGRAMQMVEQAANHKASEELIARLKAEKSTSDLKAEAITINLRKLDELKAQQLSDIPIPGLEISDGDLLVDSIPYDRVNEAEKSRIAVEIMCLNQGELPLMILDRSEVMDNQNWESFKKACLNKGIQLFTARVTDDPELTIRTSGKE